MKKLGDYMIYPLKSERRVYSSQIEAEIRCRKHLAAGMHEFRDGAIVVKVVSVVTKDKVESE